MSWSNESANSATWDQVEQAGEAWNYNDGRFTYNGPAELFYNGYGTTQSYSNVSQSSAPTWSNVTAN